MSDWVQKYMAQQRQEQAEKGGPGSGHHGHSGRPGQVGGSAPAKGRGAAERTDITELEASELHRLMLGEGGFTYNPVYDDSPKEGYALSIYPEAEKALGTGEVTADTIYQYLLANRERFESPDTYVGGWFDIDNDIVYLDISVIVQGLGKAISLAQQHNQEGIYDLGKGETIIVKAETERRRTTGTAKTKEYQ